MLTALTAFIRPPHNRGTSLPFDGVVEFSRNERGREVVRLHVLPTPNDINVVGEQITIRLMKARRDRSEEVVSARKVFAFSAPPPTNGEAFEYDLRYITNSDDKSPFPLMRRGNYFFEITHTGGTTGPTAISTTTDDWRVALLTTDQLEADWLLGTTRRSNDNRSVRFQPREVTGVRIIEVGRNYPLDLFPLALVKGNETSGGSASNNTYLSFDGGEVVRIDTSIPTGIDTQYVLMNRNRTNYIIVQVDPFLLPQQSITERILIDRALIDRDSLRRWIDAESEWLERSFLFTPIEPALCVSDHSIRGMDPSSGGTPFNLQYGDNSDFDIKGPPITYKPPTPGKWISILLPYGFPLKWDYLIGALEHTRIVEVNPSWIQPTQGRFIQLVPFNQALAYNFIGLMYVAALRGPVELPAFWRYRYWAGIAEYTTPADIVELIGMRAACKALAILGQMYRGGFSSQSISKGGASESVSYTASAMYGIYSATINDLKTRLEKLEIQVKRRIFGLYLTVL